MRNLLALGVVVLALSCSDVPVAPERAPSADLRTSAAPPTAVQPSRSNQDDLCYQRARRLDQRNLSMARRRADSIPPAVGGTTTYYGVAWGNTWLYWLYGNDRLIRTVSTDENGNVYKVRWAPAATHQEIIWDSRTKTGKVKSWGYSDIICDTTGG